jgi:Arm DNA-binding domain
MISDERSPRARNRIPGRLKSIVLNPWLTISHAGSDIADRCESASIIGFKYYFPPRKPGNKEKCISLGTYPDVSLEQARQRRYAARKDLASGINPTLRRTCEKICLGNTIESVAHKFIGVLRGANIIPESPSPVADLIRQALKSPHRTRSREPLTSV